MVKSISLTTLALSLGACVPATPTYLAAPADPSIGTHPSRYASVTVGVRAYDVVEPGDWREFNRRVAPSAAPERDDSNDAARRGR